MLGKLADVRLTGMSTTQLEQLAARLAPAQAARTQQRYSEQRGGPRQPGCPRRRLPAGISNSERVLLTLLYQRGLCTLDILADALGDISRSAIGNVVRETRPLLQQDGYIPLQAATRYRTAAELLPAGPPSRPHR